MARTSTFLDEVDEHSGSLRKASEEIGSTLAANGKEVSDLQARRKQRLDEYVAGLLPNVEKATITALTHKVPGFTTYDQVLTVVDNLKATYQQQIERLRTQFDPEKSEGIRMGLEVDLQKATEDLTHVQAPVDELLKIDGVKRLIKSGYKTSRYPFGWFDGQYYIDWKEADAAVAVAGFNNWRDLANQYEMRTANLATIQTRVNDLQKKIDLLDANSQSYQTAQKAQADAPAAVLDKLRVKLAAQLDCMDPVPEWMGDIAAINKKIVTLQEQNTKLQEARAKMLEQLTNLQTIRAQAVKSGKREVPDEYLKAIRSAKVAPSSGRSTSYTRNVYVHDDSWLLNAMLYSQMNNYFGHRDEFRGRYDSDFREARHDARENSSRNY